MNKICVYAICKNEIDYVDKWLDSMSEADYIVVLDTGSTDGTYEFLKDDSRVTTVKQHIFDPWRFDDARNMSMELAPDDANILMCTDLDELLEPGWADVVKENWIDGQHLRGFYIYATSHEINGEVKDTMMQEKIHTRASKWIYPVHEILTEGRDLVEEEKIVFDERVFLHHFQNPKSDRGTYFPLLKIRKEENPDDLLSNYMYAREFYNIKDYEGCIREMLAIEQQALQDDCMPLKMMVYILLGECHLILEDYDGALFYYEKAHLLDKTYLDPYIYIAQILNSQNRFQEAKNLVFTGLNNAYRHNDWCENGSSWTYLANQIIAISCYGMGDCEEGIAYIRKVIPYLSDDLDVLKTYICLLEKSRN